MHISLTTSLLKRVVGPGPLARRRTDGAELTGVARTLGRLGASLPATQHTTHVC